MEVEKAVKKELRKVKGDERKKRGGREREEPGYLMRPSSSRRASLTCGLAAPWP